MSSQPDLFPSAPQQEIVNPEDVRTQMIDLLSKARAARDEAPWTPRRQRFWRKVYPQMSNHLIDREEAAQLCLDFENELDRIDLLLAA